MLCCYLVKQYYFMFFFAFLFTVWLSDWLIDFLTIATLPRVMHNKGCSWKPSCFNNIVTFTLEHFQPDEFTDHSVNVTFLVTPQLSYPGQYHNIKVVSEIVSRFFVLCFLSNILTTYLGNWLLLWLVVTIVLLPCRLHHYYQPQWRY